MRLRDIGDITRSSEVIRGARWGLQSVVNGITIYSLPAYLGL